MNKDGELGLVLEPRVNKFPNETELEYIARLEAERDRLRAIVVLAQNVARAWGDGNNDRMQEALLQLFLRLYGQAPRQALEGSEDAPDPSSVVLP